MLFLFEGILFHRLMNDEAIEKQVNFKIFQVPTRKSHKRMLTD